MPGNERQKPSFDEQWSEFIVYWEGLCDERPSFAFSMLYMQYKHKSNRWIERLITRIGEAIMARGTSKPAEKKPAANGQWTTFVDISIGQLTFPEMQKKYPDGDSLFNAVTEALEEGYRLSFAYNPQNDGSIATFTAKGEGNPNEGCTLSAYAGSWSDALVVLLYKHEVIAKKNWRKAAETTGRPLFG